MKTLIIATATALGAVACANSATPSANTATGGQLACSQLPAESAQLRDLVLTPGATNGATAVTETRVIARAHQPTVVVGAEVSLPAPQGVTQQYLERVLTCHAASGAAAHAADPFHPTAGAVKDVAIRSHGGTFAIQIRGENPATGREILARAQALTTPAADVTVEQVGQGASTSPM